VAVLNTIKVLCWMVGCRNWFIKETHLELNNAVKDMELGINLTKTKLLLNY
jgi:hypothetical protein